MLAPTKYNKIWFVGTPEDQAYLPALRTLTKGVAMGGSFKTVVTASQCVAEARAAHADCIVTTSQVLLDKIKPEGITTGTVSTFAGSILYHQEMPILIIDPLKQSRTVNYWEFVTKKYLAKFTDPKQFSFDSAFIFKVCSDISSFAEAEADLLKADYVVFDIETVNTPVRRITCVGFSGIYLEESNGNNLVVRTYTIPLNSMEHLACIKRICENPVEKVAQGGRYDVVWLMMFGIAVENYMWDTMNLSHCLYSELPKDLGFITTLWVRDSYNWKELSESSDPYLKLLYNGKDTWGTALTFMNILVRYPDYAIKNYGMQFPLTFPAVMCEMRGIKRDVDRLRTAQAKYEAEIEADQEDLNRTLGFPINVASPKQKLNLLHALGFKAFKSSDDKHMQRAAFQHPLYAHIIEKITGIVKKRKLLSTYLTEGKEYRGRILYSLIPPGTDSGRMASKASSFWCGLQLQNIPRGDSVKSTLVADDGYLFNECDSEQAESRDTAFASGSAALINAVSGDRDFHSVNCSAFFGVPYENIYDSRLNKVLDKPLRDLAKRVNHGANYCMGASVLVDTMGLKKIYQAAKLLKLPGYYSPIQIAEHLLAAFHRTYPELEHVFYKSIIRTVVTTHKLTGAQGWTRYCFGRPDLNKSDKNAYVAHKPQSENAMRLNKAFMRIFYELMLNPDYYHDLHIFGQIHDSVPHQVREGKEYLTQEIKKRMEIPVTVTGADGVVRTYTVPAACKTPAKYWSDCE